MFLIFSWNNDKTKNEGHVECEECPICSKTNVFCLLKVTSWIELFFIPVIPYRTKYYLLCTNCENGEQILDEYELKELRETVNSD